jgi:hypothetical protein
VRRPAIGVIYSPGQAQVKNGEITALRGICPGTSLVCGGMNRYLAGGRIHDLPCE